MPKHFLATPGDGGAVAVCVADIAHEAGKFVSGHRQTGAMFRMLPDDSLSRFERMGARALVHDPRIIHELDDDFLAVCVNDSRRGHQAHPYFGWFGYDVAPNSYCQL